MESTKEVVYWNQKMKITIRVADVDMIEHILHIDVREEMKHAQFDF